jgi:hypothetical protein
MEETWKRNCIIPYSEMPLYTNIFSIFMEDGRENEK